MSLYNDFCEEVNTQLGVITYIETCCFEEEYHRTKHILKSPLRPVGDMYNENVEFIAELKLNCQETKNSLSANYTETDEFPTWLKKLDRREPLGELIDYCVNLLDNEEKLDYDLIKSEMEQINNDADEIIYSEEDIKKAISIAPLVLAEQRNIEICKSLETINRLLSTLDILDITKNTNIYRQSFISIFSIFDVYIFDFLKQYFVLHIDELEKFFEVANKEKLKITYEDALAFSTLEELKNNYVEERFDGKYIREILIHLYNTHPEVFNGIHFSKMLEMVNRRNIHIHNRGIVDARYIENFNIFSLDIGDYAQISKQYFDDAIANLKMLLFNIEAILI